MSCQIKKTTMISYSHIILALMQLWAKQGNTFSWFWSIILSYFQKILCSIKSAQIVTRKGRISIQQQLDENQGPGMSFRFILRLSLFGESKLINSDLTHADEKSSKWTRKGKALNYYCYTEYFWWVKCCDYFWGHY